MTYPTALLSYDVTPSSVPYTADPAAPSVVNLMVTATNETQKVVECTQLAFKLHVGADGGDLAVAADGIDPSAADGSDWSISGDGAGSFTAVPASEGALAPGASIAFFLAGVQVNGSAASGLIDVWEDSDRLRQAAPLAVVKTPPGLAITRFAVSPVEVLPGSKVTLVWETTGADGCSISWSGGGRDGLPPNGSLDDYPQATTQYTLTASGGGQSVPQSLTVVVPAPYIVRFDATPDEVPYGGPSTLSWHVANAATAKVQPLDQDVDANAGTLVVTPTETTTYSLEVESDVGTAAQPWTVDVKPVAIDSFTATPAPPLWPGDPVTLAWSTRWTTGCSIGPDVGNVPITGSQAVAASDNVTYTLTGQGLQPQTATAVVVTAPTFQQLSVTADEALIVNWSTAADDVNGGPASGDGIVGIDDEDTTTVAAVAQRGGRQSRIQVDLQAEVDPELLGPMMEVMHLPLIELQGATGLNHPGGEVSLRVDPSRASVDASVSGWGLGGEWSGGGIWETLTLGAPAASEPWQVSCRFEWEEFPVRVTCHVTISVFPLEQP